MDSSRITTPSKYLQRKTGAFYTPEVLADWAAEQLLASLPKTRSKPVVLDPACGDGALLEALWKRANGHVDLIGLDLDPMAIKTAKARMGSRATLVCADSLTSDLQALKLPKASAIIANPPWGADLSHTTKCLREKGYSLAQGQYDSYDLFLEVSLRLLPKGASALFILPDSIFAPQHEATRLLLIRESRLEMIARLGEGIFPGVFRGTCVLMVKKSVSDHAHLVRCIRLRAELRKQVLAGEIPLFEAVKSSEHLLTQDQLTHNEKTEFRLDIKPWDFKPLQKIERKPLDWSKWLSIGRGIEIGKSGNVVRCTACGYARPLPKDAYTCVSCGTENEIHLNSVVQMVQEGGLPNSKRWAPLIVGQDVDRYGCSPTRQIMLGVPGIKYKSLGAHGEERLLIRKTGLGLKAAVDSSGYYTTQVVYSVLAKPIAPDFLLRYVQGLLCSRVLLAYHLRRSGDLEWRSHPYVTPTVLKELPIPWVGKEGSPRWNQAIAIAETARLRQICSNKEDSVALDLEVDRLVAGLFGLSRKDCRWVLEVIDQSHPAHALSTLRLSEEALFSPVRV